MGLWVIDLDGVLWRGPEVVAGSVDAVEGLRGRGERVVFCTNHASAPDSKADRLRSLGVPDCPVITSADAALAACAGARSALVLGDPSLVRHLGEGGLEVTDVADLPEGGPVAPADVVVVGALERWDRSRIGLAADAVRAGAKLVATNDDATFPTTGPHGPHLLPGNGALVAAVVAAAGSPATVAGKPYPPMAAVIVERHGPVDVVVGDKPETDGVLAAELGARYALVLSGVTSRADLPVVPTPWAVAEDLAALVEAMPGQDGCGPELSDDASG